MKKHTVSRMGLVVAVALFAWVNVASAAITQSEPFDYNVGIHNSDASRTWPTMGTGSGYGWGGEWYNHVGAGYQFGIATGGHTGTFADSTSMNQLGANRERNLNPKRSGGVVSWYYVSISMRGTGTTSYIRGFNGNGYYIWGLGVRDTGFAFANGNGGTGTGISTHTASTDATNPDVLVMKLTPTGGNFYDVAFWVNPTAATEGDLPAPDGTVTGAKPGYGSPETAKIGWVAQLSQIDDILCADAYEDLPLTTSSSGTAGTLIYGK